MIQNTKKVRHKAGDLVKPKPRRYIPTEHSACMALRPDKSRRYGYVYSNYKDREGEWIVDRLSKPGYALVTRYCWCDYCKTTYKDIQVMPEDEYFEMRRHHEELKNKGIQEEQPPSE